MKKSFCKVCALIGVLALSAQAQTAHDENDGADHSGHNHSRAPENPGVESDVDKFWRMSDEAFHDGDYPRAIRFHKAIVILDPHDTESFSSAAWLMWSLGQKEEALAHIERGLKANPTDSQMWDFAGQHYDLQKKATPALAVNAKNAYANAVRFLPADADKSETQMLRRRLAHAAEKSGDLKFSIRTWRKLVNDYPEEAVNKNNLARVENLRAGKKKVAVMPIVIGGASVATIALFGGVLRSRKLRAAGDSTTQTSSTA